MASKNKITHEGTKNGVVFTGSLRQPTPVEISNYCHENNINICGVYLTHVRIGDEWIDPSEARSVELVEYGETCPVCGHEFDFTQSYCPLCHRGWNDD